MLSHVLQTKKRSDNNRREIVVFFFTLFFNVDDNESDTKFFFCVLPNRLFSMSNVVKSKTSKCSVAVYLMRGERVEERKRMEKNFYILI